MQNVNKCQNKEFTIISKNGSVSQLSQGRIYSLQMKLRSVITVQTCFQQTGVIAHDQQILDQVLLMHTHTQTNCFNGFFLDLSGLAGCPQMVSKESSVC